MYLFPIGGTLGGEIYPGMIFCVWWLQRNVEGLKSADSWISKCASAVSDGEGETYD